MTLSFEVLSNGLLFKFVLFLGKRIEMYPEHINVLTLNLPVAISWLEHSNLS